MATGRIDYSSSAGDEYHRDRHREIFGNSRLIRAWSMYAAVQYFSNVKRSDDVLEIGAGTGINLAHIKHRAKVCGVEPSAFAREHCKKLGIDIYENIESLPIGQQFDHILLRHVLEHVLEPTILLRKLHNLLKERGRLTLALPCESAHAPIRSTDKDFHLYCWNRQTIHNLLVSCGFDIVSNRIHWFNGRRIFLPLLNMCGLTAYCFALRVLGRVTGASEIVVVAQLARSSTSIAYM